MDANKGQVFVSHSSDNRELAQELAAFLEARGVRIWIAPRDVRPGMDYSEQLQLAIESCVAFVVLVTDMANKSPYVRAETEMAFSTHKPIFPVRTTDIKPAAGLALFLKIRHWTDAYGPSKSSNLDRLANELQTLSAAGAPAQQQSQATAPPRSPPSDPVMPLMSAPAATAPAPAPAPAPPIGPANAEEEAKWRAAIGPNADFYLGRWAKMGAKPVNWNWPAALVNLFWMAWRKMWLPMIVLVVVLLALGLLGAASPAAAKVTLLLSIGISFVTGGFSNHLYRRQTAKLVADTSSLGSEAQMNALRARGGTSVPALVISLVAVALLTIANVLLTMPKMTPPVPGPSLNTLGPVDSYGDPLETGISGEIDLANGAATDDKPE